MARQIAIRLGTEGKAQVTADLESIGTTGDAAFNRVARAAKRSGEDASAAIAKAERDMRKLEALLPGLNPTKLDMAAGIRDQVGKSAETSASVFTSAYSQMEARARALVLALDPVAAAQDRFNAEMAEARALVSAGVLSLDQYVTKLGTERAALDAVTLAQQRGGVTAGAHRAAMAGASFQIQDFFTQVSMGANPLNAFLVQGSQLAGQFSMIEGRAGAVARFFLGPWGLAITGAGLVVGMFADKLFTSGKAAEEAKKAAEAHRKAVLDLADAQNKAILTAERKQAVDVAQISLEMKAAIVTRDRIAGELKLAQIRLENAKNLSNPAGGAEGGVDIATTVGATIDRQIADLTKRLGDNNAEIDKLQKGLDAGFSRLVGMAADAASTPEGARQARYERERAALMQDPEMRGTANAARLRSKLDELIRERDKDIKSLQENTQARRRDTETLTANSVAKMLRDAIPGVQVTSTTGGKHVKNSYHYRNQAVDFVPAGGMGSMTKDDVRRIFQSRGIDIVELLGPGDKGHSDHFHVAWTKGKMALDEFNDAAKRAEERTRDLENLTSQFDPATAAAESYRATLAKIAALSPPNADTLRANAWADYAKKRADAFTLDSVEVNRPEYDAETDRTRKLDDERKKAAEYAADYLADQRDRLALLTRERDLIAANDNYREVELEKLRVALDLRRRAPEMAQADIDAILRTIDAQEAMSDEIRRTGAALDEMRQFGLDFVDTVLSEDTWSSWGNAGKATLNELKNEFLKLALLNPIRNLINGNSDAPSLGSLFGNIAGLFGGGSSMTPMTRTGEIRNMLGRGLASGTEYWSGGAALVGEHGPEIANLPAGTRVTPAAATRRMMDESGRRVSVQVMPSKYFDVRVTEIAAPLANDAVAVGATRGAAGGAQMAEANATMRAARRLGRRW